MAHLTLTLPDGKTLRVPRGVPGHEVAAGIAKALAKKAVAMRIGDVLCDLDRALETDCAIEFITRDNDAALELIRHDLAHVMAQAVTELFPTAKPTIGPVIDGGFYYDFHYPASFTEADLARIEKRMRQIVDEGLPLVREDWDRAAARQHFVDAGEHFKVELVDAIPAGQTISFYRQGPFLDLCRGPHMPTTRHAGKAFKLMSVAGSYWRGDARRESLQRIYGTAWRTANDLKDHLHRLAEAARRDHRKLGRAMGLFHLQDETAGSVFWHPHGWTVFRELESYMRARQAAAGYAEIKTPMLVDRSLWERSGHWAKFRENMYLVENEDGIREYAQSPADTRVFGLKPMNCPCHVLVFRQGSKSYRDLPLRLAEFGSCHRCEPSGALHGIMRVRAFTQDDAHIFCTPEQIVSETADFMRLLDQVYSDLGFTQYKIKYADRPAVRAGTDQAWDNAEAALLDACRLGGVEYELNRGEGAFYGPKLEFVLTDAIGREWQCGTLQVDFVLPESLDAEYTGMDGRRQRPAMLHRAILGSFERFLGILIEHTDGHFPLWLAANQVTVTTIVSAADDYARQVTATLRNAGLRARSDLRNEKISYKIREHSAAKVPVICVVGEREARDGTVTLRRLGSRDTTSMKLSPCATMLAREAQPPHKRATDHGK